MNSVMIVVPVQTLSHAQDEQELTSVTILAPDDESSSQADW
jgi:hypothetical protein